MFSMESTTKIQTSGPTIDGAVDEFDIATTPEYIFKITINLAAEDGKTYAVVEFLERGALCD